MCQTKEIFIIKVDKSVNIGRVCDS